MQHALDPQWSTAAAQSVPYIPLLQTKDVSRCVVRHGFIKGGDGTKSSFMSAHAPYPQRHACRPLP